VQTHVIPGYSRFSVTRPAETEGTVAWGLLLRTHAALVPELGRLVEDATGLPLTWYDVLLELNRAPERRLRMTELGERVVLSRSQVSRLVDDMIEGDLVGKQPDPTDGRATLAFLTPKGRGALRRAAPFYLEGIERLFSSRLTGREIKDMTSALTRVLE